MELKIIALSAEFILYRFFSIDLTRDFSSVGRLKRRLPKVGSVGRGGFLDRFLALAEGVLEVLGCEVPDVSVRSRLTMVTVKG